MTAQEQQLIDELVDRIRNTSVQNKDIAAEQHLQQGLSGTPDALYILAQTVIVQKYGLEQAQARLQAMQTELDSLRQQSAQAAAHPSGGSFLSHIFGGASTSSQSTQAQPPQGWQPVTNAGYAQAGGVPPPVYPSPGYGQPSGWSAAPSGGGGFLQGALQTAAGVAMGEMAFQSMESLFHGFGGGGGYGGYGGRGFEGGQPSETIINNYNDGDDARRKGSRDRDDSSFYNPTDDASRDNDKGAAFAGTDQGNSDQEDGSFADNADGNDNSDNDDSGDDNTYDSGGDDGSGGGDDSF